MWTDDPRLRKLIAEGDLPEGLEGLTIEEVDQVEAEVAMLGDLTAGVQFTEAELQERLERLKARIRYNT